MVEQVSHHPPITAYYISNPTKGLALQGHSAQKTSFSSGSIVVKQIGHAVLTVDLPGGGKEEFLITLPRLRIDGIWYGSPYIELTGLSYIQSSSGWLSTVRIMRIYTHAVGTIMLIVLDRSTTRPRKAGATLVSPSAPSPTSSRLS